MYTRVFWLSVKTNMNIREMLEIRLATGIIYET